MRSLLDVTLAKLDQLLAHHPEWPFLSLPEAIGQALGVPPDQRCRVLAGGMLLYLAADVTDDAQDGDLPEVPWGNPPWPRAVNLGNALLFGAVSALRGTPELLATAGIRMAGGQHLDLDLPRTEAEYLACIEGKSGASLGLLCEAMATHGNGHALPARDLGVAVGSAIQLQSDIAELFNPAGTGRDLALGKRTLPILHLEAWQGKPFDPEPFQDDRVALLGRFGEAGTAAYCQVRLETYHRRAAAALAALHLADPGPVALILEVVRQSTQWAI
jgi:geranylgeranyl pyrophosphate synthase